MPTLLWQRDLASDASGVKNTFSSWDSCMAESYCKWPAIVGIIIGSLIVISIIWCCARCLCCGAECCCGCLSCFNRCCPSPRRSKSAGYEKPQPYNSYNSQYQSPAPMYFGGGYRAPQTATFDSPSNNNYNEDSLPAMPTWSTAQSKRVEEDNLELEKLNYQPASQQQNLLHQRHESEDSIEQDGDVGHAAPYAQTAPYHELQNQHYAQVSPYQEQGQFQEQRSHYQPQAQAQYNVQNYSEQPTYNAYSQHQQYAGSPTSPVAPSEYLPTYQTRPPSSVYTSPYGAAPSYRTAPPSIASPPPQHAQMYGVGRKPVNGSWRDI